MINGGAWLSGYAPLTNENGEAVAVVGVDYKAETLADKRQHIFNIILYINFALIIPFAVLSWYTSWRIGRPYRMLVKAMDRVRHGELDYTIKPRRKGEEFLIADLFHTMRDTLYKACRREQASDDNRDDNIRTA